MKVISIALPRPTALPRVAALRNSTTMVGSAGGRSVPLTPAESVASCLDVVQGLARSDNGAFLGYAGKSLPW